MARKLTSPLEIALPPTGFAVSCLSVKVRGDCAGGTCALAIIENA